MHARKTARDALFPSTEDDAFFAPRRGDIVLRTHAAARAFADRVNQREQRASVPGSSGLRVVSPAELSAMVLLHEIFHHVIGRYRERHPSSFERFVARVEGTLGEDARWAISEFLGTFPPPRLYRLLRSPTHLRAALADPYLDRPTDTEIEEEMLLLWVQNQNPAYEPVRTVISDHELGPAYRSFISEATRFFADEPAFGPHGETLVDLLLAPGREHPTSIFAQLGHVEESWRHELGLDALPLWDRVAGVKDLRAEEGKWFQRGGPGPGEPLLETMRFGRKQQEEPRAFSQDLNWMPNVVLVAKSAYVWLEQLARKYQRPIDRLDQIPDEELDVLRAQHINALWLIGLFERSRASRKIKQMHGDTQALASAYSLASYTIAHELGGMPAYENLKARAWQRGIRLAADMVPNHVGVDGDWVMEHPDWFLQAAAPPFPVYRFGGPELSDEPRVSVTIEEGYWNRTDAAVVFQRRDTWTGEERFIYHGNDGTSTPWNDTAQLDYMNPAVRHAVIETILRVAQMFPIIRFDAAMTLAKRHIQRLWFPLPGEGAGAIPSRADYAMTQEELDAAMPNEFWREVVDAVAARAPNTLLLAEAFWMMEGYFVRTLGMHRVYNSAFMNMLKREENAKYRQTIKNVLDFEPEILKRFVNFMNNPDEETAVAQFGEDDRYFGVCVVMCTMPGLPMFGHGQIEGLREKYGMEYSRPRFNESPNAALVERHNREIFPLLEKRYLFSGVENFALYDFMVGNQVDEDVYAYSNGVGSERALVLFNNRFKNTRGRVLASTHRSSLAHELGLDEDAGWWVVIRDLPHGLEYLRPTKDVVDGGLSWELLAFKYHVLTGFRPVTATLEHPYDRLAAELDGRGVADVEVAVRELYLRPIHAPLRAACSKGHIAYLTTQLDAEDDTIARDALEQRLSYVADGLDWMLSQRAKRDVTVERQAPLSGAVSRYVAIRTALAAPVGAEADSMPESPRAPAHEVEPTPETPEIEPTPETPEIEPTPETPEIEPAPETPEIEPTPETPEIEPAPETPKSPEVEPTPEEPATELAKDAAAEPTSVLPIDMLLTWLSVEAAMDLLAGADAALEEARSRPPAYLSTRKVVAPDPSAPQIALPVDASAEGISTPRLDSVPPERTSRVDLSREALEPANVALTTREATLATWDLYKPIVDALETVVDPEEAKRRTALILLAATLPLGPIAPALRLAFGTRRGQVFLDLHEADGTLWISKERFEELAQFLEHRETALGRCGAVAGARAMADLAEREGYRAERIAAALGPLPTWS